MFPASLAIARSPSSVRETRSSHAARPGASLLSSARSTALPPEIAFLANYGVPVGALVGAAAEARRINASPQSVLINSGALSDDEYFAALARRVGLPFTTCPENLGSGPGAPQAARAGIAPIAPGASDMLVAPDGPIISVLFQMQRNGALPLQRMTITTPRRFAAWVRQSAAQAIADEASSGLRRFDAELSASSGASHPQLVAIAALVLLASGALLFSDMLWFGLSLCLTLAMTSGALLRLLATVQACSNPPEPQVSSLSEAELPVYTIIVPLYREADVAPKLASALARLDYPRAKLDIKIVVEADDEATRQAFEALALPACYEIIVAPDGAPRTKPRALNVALPFARGALVTVYDAEDEPERDQLRMAAARFAQAPAALACLQARLAIDNSADSWIAALFAIEYAALFDVINPGLASLDLAMPLGGTSNHFRVGALRELQGWDAWNVTEDADLGIRLARFGYRVGALASTTHEEAPANVAAWIAQRSRWQKGWMQTFLVVSRDPRRLARELGGLRAVAAILLLVAGVLGPLLGPALLIMMAHDAMTSELLRPTSPSTILASTVWCSSFVMCLASIAGPTLIGVRRRNFYAEARWLPLLPAYYLLMCFASWRAVIELVFNPYHWSKTTHGLARSSRLRQPQDSPAQMPDFNADTCWTRA